MSSGRDLISGACRTHTATGSRDTLPRGRTVRLPRKICPSSSCIVLEHFGTDVEWRPGERDVFLVAFLVHRRASEIDQSQFGIWRVRLEHCILYRKHKKTQNRHAHHQSIDQSTKEKVVVVVGESIRGLFRHCVHEWKEGKTAHLKIIVPRASKI